VNCLRREPYNIVVAWPAAANAIHTFFILFSSRLPFGPCRTTSITCGTVLTGILPCASDMVAFFLRVVSVWLQYIRTRSTTFKTTPTADTMLFWRALIPHTVHIFDCLFSQKIEFSQCAHGLHPTQHICTHLPSSTLGGSALFSCCSQYYSNTTSP